jgi:hypothetical protein
MDRGKAVLQPVRGSVSLQDVATFCQEGKLRRRTLKKVSPTKVDAQTTVPPPKPAADEVLGQAPPGLGRGLGRVDGQVEDDPSEEHDASLPDLIDDEEEGGDEPSTDWEMGDHLTPDQKSKLQELLDENRDVFAFTMEEMTTVRGENFKITLTDDTPIFRPQYRLSYAERDILKEQMEERLKCRFIRPSTSQFAAPVTMPPKKDEHGNWIRKRPCGDYRGLNKVTLTDHYQMPTPEEIFAQLNGATIFTTLDLRWGYHQVAIDEEDCCKTAF